HPRLRPRQTQRFAAQGVAVRAAFGLPAQVAAQGAVDRVAHADRAVVVEILVAVERVFRQRVDPQRLGQRARLRVAQVEPLQADLAAF
ncbi:hypothetical protein CLOM621_09140, partial [Clostridium sp. M62/1]